MDMAGEIDNFLIKNFRESFDQKKESGSKFRLQAQFQEIRDLLDNFNIGNCSPTATASEKNQMRETLYSLDDVWTECQITSKTNLLARDPLRRKLIKIKEEIQKFNPSSNGGTNTQQSNDRQVSSIGRWSSRSVDASKVHGFGDDVISLEKVLLKQGSEGRFKAIGITGIAGIGKTTLCKVLFNKKEVKDYFFPRIWVCMSAQPAGDDPDQKIAILKRMLESLGVEEETINNYNKVDQEHNLKELLYALHLQLQGKRYLIVFDDARGGEIGEWYGELSCSSTRDGKWDALAYGLPKGCGGAVIVTSRNEEIAKKMVGREGILHLVQPLSEPESCWSIFKEEAEPVIPSDAEIEKREIFKRCAGLPLTAKMMGRIFKKKPTEGATPNGSHQQLQQGAAPNGSHQQLPEGATPNESHQQLPEGAAPTGSLQQLPEEGGSNESHQRLPEGAALNGSLQQLPEEGAPNGNLQQLPEEGAPNGNLQQNGSLPQLPEEGAPNGSLQQNGSLPQLPEEGAPNGSLQQLPEEGAPNGSLQEHPEGAAQNGSLQQQPEGAAPNGSRP